MVKVKDVVRVMEEIAPPRLAKSGDPIGLHSGSMSADVTRIAVSLDATSQAIRKAADWGAEMLVVHHPRFHGGLSTLSESDVAGRRAALMVREKLAVYSAHTNLDTVPGGTNDLLADAAGLVDTRILLPHVHERLMKLAVFVPATHAEKVRKALCAAGAGHIGNYSDCTFMARGTGTFRGKAGSNPFLGKAGALEEADEFRLETVFGEFSAPSIINAMTAAHPYEEVAYDLHPLVGREKPYGLGRVGVLPRAETVRTLAERVAKAVGSPMAQYYAPSGGKATRVAVWAGQGADVKAILSLRPDALVTGELGYHDLEQFVECSIAVVTLGHGYSEEPVLKPLTKRLAEMLPGTATKIVGRDVISMRNVLG